MKEVLTLKEIMETEGLAKHIAEDIDDIPDDAPVTYEVWAIGYDNGSAVTDSEMLLKEFTDPDKAVEFAKTVEFADVIYQAANDDTKVTPIEPVAYIQIEVETVVSDSESDEPMNIGTIYRTCLYPDLESELSAAAEYEDVVRITADDYALLEDGSIEVDRELLKDFCKNDMVQFMFIDENKNTVPILTYKIVSKTTDNKFVCEFIY